MPSLFRFLVFVGLLGGLAMARFSRSHLRAIQPREISVTIRPIDSSSRRVDAQPMARATHTADESLVELFLDMQAAERGAGENTLAAYRNDLADLSRICAPKAEASRRRRPTTCADFSPASPSALQGVVAGAAAVGGAPTLPVLYAEANAATIRPRCSRDQTRAHAAENSLHCRSRWPADSGAQQCRRRQATTGARLRAARLLCLLEVVYATACACRNWWRCRRWPRGEQAHAGPGALRAYRSR